MNLQNFHSITKKITVALLGGFLLIFVLFHACANLCILRNDDGAWYSAFCHFMGTNYIIKVFEVILMLTVLLHICLTVWLYFTNRAARGPVRYKHASRTKTHTGSKLMIWTGILILAALVCHFCDFYFVKMDLVEGKYMVKTEAVSDPQVNMLKEAAAHYHATANEILDMEEAQMQQYAAQASPDQMAQITDELTKMRAKASAADFMLKAEQNDMITEDGKWIKKISKEDKEMLETAFADADVEPDFYNMAREKFKQPLIAILYLIFFVVLWFHMRHALPSAFQTLGLNNYKYNKALDIFGEVYAWMVCLMFAAVPIVVMFLL